MQKIFMAPPSLPVVHQVTGGCIALFDDVRIDADTITDPRWDRVLPIYEEAQVFMCRQMSALLEKLPRGSLILDVGTGSGVFAIWAAKRGHRVVGIDINQRALRMAHQNMVNNGIELYDSLEKLEEGGICLLLKRFDEGFANDETFRGKFDCVLLNPPYNPTCPGVRPALHAESGKDGQRCFRDQIALVPELLNARGWCVGIQLTTKDKDDIQAIGNINEAFRGNCLIQYTHILDKKYFPTQEFLQHQYEAYLSTGRYSEPNSVDVENYILEVSSENPQLAFIYYEVHKDLTGQKKRPPVKLSRTFAPQRGWYERIQVHKQIVENTTPSTQPRGSDTQRCQVRGAAAVNCTGGLL